MSLKDPLPPRFWTLIVALPLVLALAPTVARAQETESSDLRELEELIRSGDYDEAQEWLEEEDPGFAPLLRARLLRETGRGEEALTILEASSSYLEGAPAALIAAGALLSERGESKRAEELFRKALEADSKQIEARTRLGLSLIGRGRRPEGRGHLRRIIDFYQGLSVAEAEALAPLTYVWMGRACEGLDRFDEAYNVMYSSALDLDAGCVEAHVASGWILLAKYNYPDARSHFEDALKRNGNHAEANIGLAAATVVDYRVRGNRFARTLGALATADRVWKDHPKTLELRGDLAFSDEKWSEAEDYYRRAIEKNPANLRPWGLLAAILFSTHRLEELESLRREVARLHPTPAPFYGALAERLVERFFYEEATDFAREAVALDPDYWPAYVILGINALRVGREEEGRKWVERAFQADRYNLWAYNTRKLIRHIDKRFTEEKTPDFIIRMREEERPYLMPYLRSLLEETRIRLERKYEVIVETPIRIEDFSEHRFFSARSIGLPGLAASGVCFGRMVTLTTPKAIPGNWGVVAVHELAHVITLQKTKNRVPRWFTEGLSVFEEGGAHPRWRRTFADEFVEAVHHGNLLGMREIQGGFTKPRYPGQILLAYYQGGVICSFIDERWGFDKILLMLERYAQGWSTEKVIPEVLGVSIEEFDKRFAAYSRELADSFGIWPRILEEQIQRLRFQVEDHPGDAESWVKLGLAYLFTGKLADAELAVGRAMKLKPDDADLAFLKGLLKLQQKKTKSAITELERAIEHGTHYRYRARVALAILLGAEKKREKAIELLREAITIHPDGVRPRFRKPNPYYLLAELLNEEGREEEVIEVLEALVRVSRDDIAARKRLGVVYQLREEWGKLVDALADGVFIDPYDMDVHRMLARAYLRTEAFRRALRELMVLTVDEHADLSRIYPDIAWCHHKLGNREKAVEFAEKTLTLDSDNERAKEILSAE